MTEEKKCRYVSPPDHRGEAHSCQFESEVQGEDPPIQLAGLNFCKYHAPISSDLLARDYGVEVLANNGQFKENWDAARCRQLNSDIRAMLVRHAANRTWCDLTGVSFPSGFDASNMNHPSVSFKAAKFDGLTANFRGANFVNANSDNKGIDFSHAEFLGNTDFHGALFPASGAVFQDAKFVGAANFNNAQFLGLAVFVQTTFSGGGVRFVETKFSKSGAFFHRAHFWLRDDGSELDFSVPFEPNSVKNEEYSLQNLVFFDSQIEVPTSFDNRNFEGSISFHRTRFWFAPTFFGCSLHQDTEFPTIEYFEDTVGDERAYRTLRLAMKQQEAHDEEAMFWALEQRTKRNNLDPKQPKHWFPWVLSWGYDLLSEYGLNATRPLGWLVCWLLFYGLLVYDNLNATSACWKDHVYADQWLTIPGKTLWPEIWSSCEKIVSFSIAQSARPFFIWGDYEGTNITTTLGPSAFMFWVKLAATFDSAVSLTLVALFILAVRRRFRMQ